MSKEHNGPSDEKRAEDGSKKESPKSRNNRKNNSFKRKKTNPDAKAGSDNKERAKKQADPARAKSESKSESKGESKGSSSKNQKSKRHSGPKRKKKEVKLVGPRNRRALPKNLEKKFMWPLE